MADGVDRADWVQATLGELFSINPKSDLSFPSDYKVSFVPMKAVEAMTGKMDTSDTRPIAEVCKGYVQFCEGDVLLAKITPCMENGKVVIAKGLINGIGFGSTEFHVFRSALPETACWLFLYFLQSSVRRDARKNMTGSAGQLRVPKNYLCEIPIPLPPLVEQRAIVAKIEALFSELDKGVEQLETVKGQLKRYRQSVLKAAFEGKLTAEWRAERARPFVQNSAQLKVAETPETYGTKKPERWTFVRTEQLAEFVTSGSRGWSKYCGSTGALFIRSQDINRDTLALESVTRVNPPGGAEGNRTRVKTGDILLTITGANVGKCACVDRELPEAYVSQHVALLRLHDTVLPSYLHWVFLSDAFVRGQLHRVAYGAGKPGLNLENVKDALIPLAPLPEQRQIVAEIEVRFSALDQLEQTVETGLKQAEALRQSILKKAFDGRLLSASERAAVRADPAYEPAARLLERIRAERAAQSGLGGLRGRAPKKRPVSTASTPSTVSTPPTPKRRARP